MAASGLSNGGILIRGNWTNITNSSGPGPSFRKAPAMAYDAADDYVVLFGGYASASMFYSDTWTFHAGKWTQLFPASHPPARAYASMVYDAKDGYILLFGGFNHSGKFGDTWTFRGGVWTQWFLSVSPAPRYGASMAFDPHDNYTVLFGGQSQTAILNDTWTFLNGNWTQLTIASPARRLGAEMVYDYTDGYVFLWGGFSHAFRPSCTTSMRDVWGFVSGRWSLVINYCSVSGHFPRAVYGAGVASDSSKIMILGGIGNFNHHATRFFLSGRFASKLTFATLMTIVFPGLAHDPADHEFVAFFYGYTWVFH